MKSRFSSQVTKHQPLATIHIETLLKSSHGELLFPKLVVFGASGPKVLEVVQKALAKGYAVTAVVRGSERFSIK